MEDVGRRRGDFRDLAEEGPLAQAVVDAAVAMGPLRLNRSQVPHRGCDPAHSRARLCRRSRAWATRSRRPATTQPGTRPGHTILQIATDPRARYPGCARACSFLSSARRISGSAPPLSKRRSSPSSMTRLTVSPRSTTAVTECGDSGASARQRCAGSPAFQANFNFPDLTSMRSRERLRLRARPGLRNRSAGAMRADRLAATTGSVQAFGGRFRPTGQRAIRGAAGVVNLPSCHLRVVSELCSVMKICR